MHLVLSDLGFSFLTFLFDEKITFAHSFFQPCLSSGFIPERKNLNK